MSHSDDYSDEYTRNHNQEYSQDSDDYESIDSKGYIPRDSFKQYKLAHKTLKMLRNYAWHRGLDIFMSDDCVNNLVELLPNIMSDKLD
jgi:hypothetical protein